MVAYRLPVTVSLIFFFNYLFFVFIPVSFKMAESGLGCLDIRIVAGLFGEERSRLPCTKHSQFQQAPMTLLHGTAGPSNRDGADLGKTSLRHGKMLHGSEECRKSASNSKVCYVENAQWEQIFPDMTAAYRRAHIGAQEEKERVGG